MILVSKQRIAPGICWAKLGEVTGNPPSLPAQPSGHWGPHRLLWKRRKGKRKKPSHKYTIFSLQMPTEYEAQVLHSSERQRDARSKLPTPCPVHCILSKFPSPLLSAVVVTQKSRHPGIGKL